jgi:hypothetical protein
MAHHSVVVGEKVVFSLRTKEAKVARERFPPALDALNAFFKSLGEPPQTLSRTDARALAGEIYRQAVQDIDRHDAIADEVEALRDELAESSAHYQREGEDEKSAELSAAIDLYDERALLAWGLKHGDPLLSREELLERFFGPVRSQIQIAGSSNGKVQPNSELVKAFADYIVANHIDVVIVDPFVATHSVNENDNMSIDTVARAWFDVARDGNCAVHLVHHSKKGERNDADAESARGAVALRDAVRYVRNLSVVESHIVEANGWDPIGRYVRIDVTKTNYSEPGRPEFFEIRSHLLENTDTVGVAVPLEARRDISLQRGRSTSRSRGGSKGNGAPRHQGRQDPKAAYAEKDIATAVQVAASGDYTANPSRDDWLGHFIAEPLGRDAGADSEWLMGLIQHCLDRNRLEKTRIKKGKRGTPPDSLKPPGTP